MGYQLTGDQLKAAMRRIGDIQRQLGQEEYPHCPKALLDALQAVGEGRFGDILPILCLISGGHELVIDETDGTETILGAKDVFPGGIDSDFVHWGADEPSGPTPKTPVDVYELAQDGTFEQMFGSICSNPERLCFIQSQIIGFVKKYPNWLHPRGWSTFFPFRSKGNFFVAVVGARGDGRLCAGVRRRGYGRVWGAGRRLRVVFPQLRPFVS